jgi:DNA-binding NarL/FixJ family response regulator
MKVLLVEDNLEEEQLLTEVLIEMEENRRWCNWRNASVVHVEQLADALKCLSESRFDVVLLNLTLPDSPALLDSFHKVNDGACGAPIIILADEDDPNLAHLLLREGAQDVLLKSEMETAPFARSLRYALERQRAVAMLAPSRFDDNLTATATRPYFLCLGAHYVQFGRLTSFPLLLASVEIPEASEETPADRETRDLVLLRAGEVLASAFQPPALIGRVGRNRFALMTAGFTETTLEALLNRAALDIQNADRQYFDCSGAVRFTIAQIRGDVDLDQMLGRDGDEFAESAHRRAKTAMLAD